MSGLSIAGKRGFTLMELMTVIVVVAILAAIAYPTYQSHVRESRLAEAHAALLDNTRHMERFYAQNRSFKLNSTTWPPLPHTETSHFCIKFQGNARGVLGDQYTIKAVAFDSSSEPRVLLIDQNQQVRICGRSSSRCDERATFAGNSGVDRECQVYR